MNQGYRNSVAPFAAQAGLSMDSTSGIVFGNYGGYDIILSPMSDNRTVCISCFVKRAGAAPQPSEVAQIAKANKHYFGGCTVTGYRVNFLIKSAGLSLKKTVNTKLREALEILITELQHGGYTSCCQLCGSTEDNGTYYINGGAEHLCGKCYQEYTVNADTAKKAYEGKNENVIGGIVGALLGSFIGVAAIIIISQLGYIAAISGVIMGVCALKGYELLGGKLSKKGIVISCAMMIVAVFLSYQMDLAIYLASEAPEYSVFDCFRIMNSAVFSGLIDLTDYLSQLIILYLFTALGAVPTIVGSIKKQKRRNVIFRLDAPKESVGASAE